MEEFVGPYVNHIGSATHPNGTVFLLVTHKVGTGDFNAEIWRDDPPHAAKPRLITTLPINGPAGFGTVECRNDGSLLIYIGAGLVDEKRVGGNKHIIPGVAQPWTVTGMQLLPIPTQSNGIDTQARSQAVAALEVAKQATATARQVQDELSKAQTIITTLQQQLAVLKVPSQQDIKDIAWSLAADRIKSDAADPHSEMCQRIAVQSQANLLLAIKYALDHPSTPSTPTPSKLRALVETVMKGK